MRILVVGYEFPPSPSPQSLRWAYLARELASRGHEVHVLAPDLPGSGAGLPSLGRGVVVHRVHAGPIMGLVAARSKGSLEARGPAQLIGEVDEQALREGVLRAPAVHLNWKGRLFQQVRKVADLLLFPDIRGEWTRGAGRALRTCLETLRPDIVVTSHEPASTLELGLLASDAGVPWLADLGDPVLAHYTPRRWRRRAWSLERRVCRRADAVTVTTEATAELLRQRHGPGRRPYAILPQGYDATVDPQPDRLSRLFQRGQLELLYTGSFYRFREPMALIEAVVETPGVRLTIASMALPPRVASLSEQCPDKLRVLGFLRHTDVLALQRVADVLVNIGNLDATQIPGKLFEYMGSGRPILHLGPREGDYAATLLGRAGAGWVCENDGRAIAAVLASLCGDKRENRLGAGLIRNQAVLARYRWDTIAEACETILAAAVRARHPLPSDNLIAYAGRDGTTRH